jgi:DNA-binding response OmpR family regulator
MKHADTTLHVLLLTADPLLASTFTNLFGELNIEAHASDDSQHIADQLNRAKYEGIVLDFDTVSNARPVLANVRESRSNKNAIVFAVATNANHAEQALEDHAHFLLRRPIEIRAIRQTLGTAYDLMLGERRRHFRYAVNLQVGLTIIASGTSLQCSTINVSGHGMAVTNPSSFKLAETLDIALLLSDGFTVRATGTVIWDDKHGKSGLHFQCSTPEMRNRLDSWLDSQFAAYHARQ